MLGIDDQTTLMWLTLTQNNFKRVNIDWKKVISAGNKWKIDEHTVRKVLDLLKYAKTAEVYS